MRWWDSHVGTHAGERACRAVEGNLTRGKAIPSNVRDEVVPMIPWVEVKVSHPRGMSGG